MSDFNLEEMEIEIVDSKIQRSMDSMITVANKGRISLSEEARVKLDVVKDEYLIFGKIGNANFIAKRPANKGLHGYIVHKPKKSGVHYVGSLTLQHIPKGKYNFGDVIFKLDFTWFPLVKVN